MLGKLLAWSDGYKTYAIALGAIIWAVIGQRAGWLDPVIAQQTILQALGAAALRRAIKS